jgi:CRISPR/Cas system-associated exonuclease Cas4 (RecB family)
MLIGRAYHRTLEATPSLVANAGWDPSEAAKRALKEFREVLQEERTHNSLARGRAIPWPDERVSRAEIALVLQVRQYASRGPTLQEIILERRMESQDGLLLGIADRIERHAYGVRIVDIKTGAVPSSDVGHIHQLLAYSYLWHETTGEWPVEALIEYPLEDKRTVVEISPSECAAVGDEMKVVARQFVEGLPEPMYLARPGAPCVGCNFRPWCEPFWSSQRVPRDKQEQLTAAEVGVEGIVDSVKTFGEHWRIELRWWGGSLPVLASSSIFPQIEKLRAGDRVRLIDMNIRGSLTAPVGAATGWSEIFTVVNGDA